MPNTEKVEKAAATEREVRAAIKKMLTLNRKTKLLIAKGLLIAKRFITKNKRKIRKYELAMKERPQADYKKKIDDLKAKNVLLEKITTSFSSFKAEINKEVGWLTNEAGALGNAALVSKAVKAESAGLLKQRELIITMLKTIKILKVKKPVLKAKPAAAAPAAQKK